MVHGVNLPSKAARLAVNPRRHHRTTTAAITLVGTGMLAGAAYGGWKTYSPPPELGSNGHTADHTPAEPSTKEPAA